MQLLGSLGIDLKLLLAQIINFAILLWLLNKLLYKPIVKRIESDEEQLRQVEKEKESLTKDRQSFEKEKHDTLIKVKKEAEKIITEAEDISDKMKHRIHAEAEKEKEQIIKQIQSRLKDTNG